MSHYGTLQKYPSLEQDAEIRGAKVYGTNNEKLGEIDDVILDHETGEIRYIVVETGGWLHSHRFVIPAERLRLRGNEEKNEFSVDLSKEQIEKLPAYDSKHLENQDHWRNYEERYFAAWSGGPVLHREDSSHLVTPTPEEMPMPGGSGNADFRPEPFQPRGVQSSLNSSGAASINLTPVTSTLDTRYTGGSTGRPVGTHGIGNMREPVEPAATEEMDRSDDPAARARESMHTPEGDSIFNNADTESRHGFQNRSGSSQASGNPSLGRRWANFQDHLHAKRQEISGQCNVCTSTRKIA